MSEPSRRDFLKTSAVASVVGTTLFRSVSARAFAGGNDEIRVGLVGCGGRGSGAASQALSTDGKVKLVAVADAFQDRLDRGMNSLEKSLNKKKPGSVEVDDDHKFVGLDAYKKVIDSDIDLVILATPPGFRPAQFEYAVDKGVHVFMEKPVASDAPGVKRVLDAARKAKEKNLAVGVGLQRRHQPCYLQGMERVHNGDIGDIRSLRVYWNSNPVWDPRATREECKSEMEYQIRNWYYYNWLSGDHIVEQHIHNIDIGRWFMRDQLPVSAVGMGGRQFRTDPKYGEIFDHFAVQYLFPDGTVMVSECRHAVNCQNNVSEVAVGTKGFAHLIGKGKCEINIFGKSPELISTEGADPYQIEHDDLFSAIRNGKPYNEAEIGALSTMTAILGRMATYSGKEILMSDAMERGLDLMPKELAWDAATPTGPDAEGRYPVPVPGVTKVLRPA